MAGNMVEQIPPEVLAILAQQDQGPKAIGLVVAFTVLALICVVLRFFTRIRFTQLLGWEDYYIALSMVLHTLPCLYYQFNTNTLTALLHHRSRMPNQTSPTRRRETPTLRRPAIDHQ
jgi:hypothetical protein